MHILANLDVFLFHKYLMLEKKESKCNMVPPIIILKISAYALVSKYIAYGLDKQNCLINTLSKLNTLYKYDLLYKFLGIYAKDAYVILLLNNCLIRSNIHFLLFFC